MLNKQASHSLLLLQTILRKDDFGRNHHHKVGPYPSLADGFIAMCGHDVARTSYPYPFSVPKNLCLIGELKPLYLLSRMLKCAPKPY